MRIIDSNKDFYDFYANIYRDNTFVFDRRDSYDLSKEEFMSHFYADRATRFDKLANKDRTQQFLLLQVCHDFWLFEMRLTRLDNYDKCLDYNLGLLHHWKDYDKQAQLIKLSHVSFPFYIPRVTNEMVDAIQHNDFKEIRVFDRFTLWKGSNFTAESKITKHIPILKNIGIASQVDPLQIYLALEEYFALQKTQSERSESVDITNKEKIENHGFDTQTSFRGKRRKN